MMTALTRNLISLMLIVFLAVPSSLLIAPAPKAHATLPTIELSGIGTLLVEAYNLVKNTLTSAATIAQEALQYLFYVKEYILEPLAFIQSGKASQALTGGVLAFVSGGGGTGQTQFVQNLPGNLNSVGANAEQAFLREFSKNSNSPYAGSIASSLHTNYTQQSTLAGFFAANRNTLPQYTKNQNAFLAGDWSQGGPGAWFALTTQSQNNPFMLYHNSQGALGKLVTGAQAIHQKNLDWGSGFLSWCGTGEQAPPVQQGPECNVSNNFCDSVVPVGGDEGAADPGAGCTQKDGTPGIVKTPGTTITNYLDKALSLDGEKLTKMGNAATQISSLVGTLMETAQMAQIVIGGPQGGLAGVGTPINGKSIIDGYADPTATYGGVNQCSINKTMAAAPPSNGEDLLARLDPYVAAWTTIGASATAASTSVVALRDFCTAQAQIVQAKSTTQARALFVTSATAVAASAQYALTTYIAPVFTQASVAAATVANARAAVTKVRADLAAPGTGTPPVCKDYSADVQKLRTTPPTVQDMAVASNGAITTNTASSSPPGTLKLVATQGSLVDQMNLLKNNATALKASCVIPPGV